MHRGALMGRGRGRGGGQSPHIPYEYNIGHFSDVPHALKAKLTGSTWSSPFFGSGSTFTIRCASFMCSFCDLFIFEVH